MSVVSGAGPAKIRGNTLSQFQPLTQAKPPPRRAMAGASGAAPIALVYGGDLPAPHRMIGIDHVGFHLQADGACLKCTDGNKLSTPSSALQHLRRAAFLGLRSTRNEVYHRNGFTVSAPFPRFSSRIATCNRAAQHSPCLPPPPILCPFPPLCKVPPR